MAQVTAPIWRDPTGPLIRLVTAFGLDAGKLPHKESRRKLSYIEADFDAAKLALPADPVARAARIAELESAVRAANDKYGPALTFQIKIGNAIIFDQHSTIAELYRKLGDSPYVDVYLKIEKEELLKYWKLNDSAVATCLFLYSAPLLETLESPLTELDHGEDAALFHDDRKLVVLVPERNVCLDGDYLAIVGGDALERWQNRTLPDSAVAQAVYAKARDELNWTYFELARLTPLHLKTEAMPPRDDVVVAVDAQLLTCSLFYLANQSKYSTPRWVATFEAEASAVKMEIPDAAAIGEMLRSGDDTSRPAKLIAEKVKWIYEDLSQAGDRLTVAQHAIAEELEDTEPSTACRELVRRAADVCSRIDWAWQAFISGKLHIYFGQVKQLVETIDSATKSYNEQVQTFTKTLIDNMLAAVAVIIGSFIAAMFKSPFESYVFLFGTGVYVLYLLIFPIGVGLSSTWQRFRDSRSDFHDRIRHYSRGVPEDQVKKLVGTTVPDRERWFKRWLGVTTTLYLLVVALLIAAAIVVPDRIKAWSDAFTLKSVAYGPASGGTVPVTIRGESFNDEKQIVVRIGNAKYTNTDGGSLAVHGSTAVTLTPRLDELRKSKYLTVQQGTAGPRKLQLPPCP